MIRTALTIATIVLLAACNKTEGPGGTSSITGFVKSQNHQNAQTEITEIIFTQGLSVEHGDYWVLNNPSDEEQFYIYYDNPSWISDADPALAGRTGISVEFNYSDSNVEIAENTMTAVISIASDYYSITRNVDILTITSELTAETVDADKVTSPFEFNTSQQGKAALLEDVYSAVDEKVYLTYGDNTNYDDFERTGGDGEYQFNNLTNGVYTIYAISKDTVSGGTIKVSQTVEISDKKTVVTVGEIQILI